MNHPTAFVAFLLAAGAPAWATATAPGTPGTPPGGSIGDYWWLILLAILVALAIWYFTRRRRNLGAPAAPPEERSRSAETMNGPRQGRSAAVSSARAAFPASLGEEAAARKGHLRCPTA